MSQSNEKIAELMSTHYPVASKKIIQILTLGIDDPESAVELFIDGADVEYLKTVSQEMNKEVSYQTSNDNGESIVVTANLMSEFVLQLYLAKGKSVNTKLYNSFRSIESAVVEIRSKLNKLESVSGLLYSTKKELDANVAEFKQFLIYARQAYRGLSFKRIMEERLFLDNPKLKTLIETIEMYRIVVYGQITSAKVEMTDAVTHLERFVNAYKDVVILNLQDQQKALGPNAKAIKAFQIAEKLDKKKTDRNFDLEILKDNEFFMRIPDQK